MLIFLIAVLPNVQVDVCGNVYGLCAQIGSEPLNPWQTFAEIWRVLMANSWVWLKQRNGLYYLSASLSAVLCEGRRNAQSKSLLMWVLLSWDCTKTFWIWFSPELQVSSSAVPDSVKCWLKLSTNLGFPRKCNSVECFILTQEHNKQLVTFMRYYYHRWPRKPTAKVIILSRKVKVLNRVQTFNKGKKHTE